LLRWVTCRGFIYVRIALHPKLLKDFCRTV